MCIQNGVDAIVEVEALSKLVIGSRSTSAV